MALKERMCLAAGLIRVAGGLAVTQITEGTGSMLMKDGKPAGSESSGKGLFKFASGTLAALSGRADRWAAKPAGFGRFTLEITADGEPGTVGTRQNSIHGASHLKTPVLSED